MNSVEEINRRLEEFKRKKASQVPIKKEAKSNKADWMEETIKYFYNHYNGHYYAYELSPGSLFDSGYCILQLNMNKNTIKSALEKHSKYACFRNCIVYSIHSLSKNRPFKQGVLVEKGKIFNFNFESFFNPFISSNSGRLHGYYIPLYKSRETTEENPLWNIKEITKDDFDKLKYNVMPFYEKKQCLMQTIHKMNITGYYNIKV